MLLIPITESVAHDFNIELDAELYTFRLVYNSRAGLWTMDIYRQGLAVRLGLVLVLGADVLKGTDVNLGELWMFDLDGTGVDANSSDLGSRVVMYYITLAEISNGALDGLTI